MLTSGKLMGAGGVGGGITTDVSITNTDSYTRTSAHYSYSGITINIGAADPNRYVVVCVGGVTTASVEQYVYTIEVNGLACLKLTAPSYPYGYSSASGIGVIKVPTGTTATLRVGFFSSTNTVAFSHAEIYRVVGNLESATPVATGTDTFINRPASIPLSWSEGENAAVFAAFAGYESSDVLPTFDVLTSGGYGTGTLYAGGAYNPTELLGTSATVSSINSFDGLSNSVCALALK